MMRKKIIIVLKEKFENSLAFFDLLSKTGIFDVHIVRSVDFFSNHYRNILEENNIINILIVIHPLFYRQVAEELDEYLRKIDQIAVKKLLMLYTEDNFLEDHAIRKGEKHAFFLDPGLAFQAQVKSFTLYLLKVFSESLISFRLHDYIANSFQGVLDAELLKKKNEEIERLNNELVRKNRIDRLTNIYNRATIFDFLEQEQNRTQRDLLRMNEALKGSFAAETSSEPVNKNKYKSLDKFMEHYGVFSLMLIDIDQFKNINDTHGHLVGDEVLHYIGQLLMDKDIFRDHDHPGRWGGEEFLVILPDTNIENAREPAERFIRKLAQKKFIGTAVEKFTVEVSIGISQSYAEDESKEAIIKRADKAMYYAKEHGRNKIIIYEEVFKK